ncbi:MAG: Nramp family divalent metal transporter [Planctomycetaceae bacterium]|nr:Nramp family divalent metal transporter [Planctomycetaceae bacterium]
MTEKEAAETNSAATNAAPAKTEADASANAPVDRRQAKHIEQPPTNFVSILKQIGPGLIIAANIVGSGELIMTTRTGAQAGIALLWLILLGCVVKIFVQLELGRFTISHGETTLSSLNRVPGPKAAGVNWVVLLWGFMMLTTIAQLGGIVGGVGQAMALTFPISGDVQKAVSFPTESNIADYANWQQLQAGEPTNDADFGQRLNDMRETDRTRFERRMEWVSKDIEALGEDGTAIMALARAGQPLEDENGNSLVTFSTSDDRIWVTIIGLLTAVVLFVGRYKLIERFSVTLVVSFSIITMGNVIALQMTDNYSVSTEELIRGLSFGFPDLDLKAALITAFATFGIIGVGATELISYPYWCLEKGYARNTGPRDDSSEWLSRAKGWFRVMKYDAFASMIIYTIATAAFYLMGVAVLHTEGRDPEGTRLVSTLAQSYVPIFGSYARWLFLGGAIAVLYSTYLVANASNARMVADFFGVIGVGSADADSDARRKAVTIWSVVLPLACVVVYLFVQKPVLLVAIAGVTQAVMLPVIGFSSMYFRYKETDNRLRPGLLWDVFLAVSCIGLLIAGCWGVYNTLT